MTLHDNGSKRVEVGGRLFMLPKQALVTWKVTYQHLWNFMGVTLSPLFLSLSPFPSLMHVLARAEKFTSKLEKGA